MLQVTIIRSIVINLFFTTVMVYLCSCDSGNTHISTAEEIKRQIDSVGYKPIIANYKEGKQLFRQYCNTCHIAPEINMTDQYLFDDLFERLPPPAEEYFVSYISDSKAVKASGNRYAKHVDDVWQQAYEHKFKDSLSAKGFFSLITYIKIAARQRYQNKGG